MRDAGHRVRRGRGAPRRGHPGEHRLPGAAGRPRVLARRIRQLLGSRVLFEGYGIAAANRARSRYAWERIAEETLAVYEALARPRAQAAA